MVAALNLRHGRAAGIAELVEPRRREGRLDLVTVVQKAIDTCL